MHKAEKGKMVQSDFLAGLSRIKTDLNFAGISMGFASIGDAAWSPSGDGVSDGYYERPDARVPLLDGKTLHAVLGGSNEIKLTLVDGTNPDCTEGAEIGWVSAKTMKDAIEVNHGLLKVNGKALAFGAITRSLKRVVAAAS